MVKVAYYVLEAVKFLIIYLLGFSMEVTDNVKRRGFAIGITIFTGVLMNYYSLSIVYPIWYMLFAVILFYCLMEHVTYRNIFIVLWSSVVILSVDMVSYVLLRLWFRITKCYLIPYQDLFASCIALIILGIIFGIISYNQKTALLDLSGWYFFVYFIICAINASILVLIEKKLMDAHGEFVGIYIMLVINSLVQMVFVFVLISSNSWHYKNEKRKKRYLEMQVEHYRYLEERNYDTKKFRHDLRGHILVIKEYICEGKWEELRHYVDRICDEIEYIPGYLSVKNETVDAILNYYHVQFAKRDCSLEVEGGLPQRCCVQAYDLCTIFSNILSNALESMEMFPKKSNVELSVHFDDTLIYIRERNVCSSSLNWLGNEIVTAKQDKEMHGFGIRNIRDSVKKYSGTVDIAVLEGVFVIDIILENRVPMRNKR